MPVSRLLHVVLLITLLANSSISIPPAHAAPGAPNPKIILGPFLADPPPPGTPAGSHTAPSPTITPQSTRVSSSAIAQYRQDYGKRQSSSGLFDGSFSTPRVIMQTLPDSGVLNVWDGWSGDHAESQTYTLPPGWYQGIELDATTTGSIAGMSLSIQTPNAPTLSMVSLIALYCTDTGGNSAQPSAMVHS